MRSGLSADEVKGRIKEIISALFANIPSGVGSHRKDLKLSIDEEKKVLVRGAEWAVERGLGSREDLAHIEDGGKIEGADPHTVSDRAMERGRAQLGTAGSGNHFVEVGYVAEIYDEEGANALGLFRDQVTIIVHTGSRGFGYQVCDDYIKIMLRASEKYGIELPDRQLCCAPVGSEEGKKYLAAMTCAANYAFANRQIISYWVKETFEQVLGRGAAKHGLSTVYDVCHNIAKIEMHIVDGKEKKVCVHRKGATRAFPPEHPSVPAVYRHVGQPVLIPGDMGRCSYVLLGTRGAFEETFGSTCHGAGRLLSRTAAKKVAAQKSILQELANRGIHIMSAERGTLMEEIPEAYKDVSDVVDAVHGAGLSKKVAKLIPMGVIKG